MSIFGFSTETSTADFLPVCKFDARSGLWFRIDRVDTGQGFAPEPVDITRGFKAIFDAENVETGWINFPAGGAPISALIQMRDLLAGKLVFPPSPGENFKQGVRFMLKLAKDVGGDKPVREVMATSKAFIGGIEALYSEYLKEAAANAGKLPVIVMDGITMIKTGSGAKTSSNYRPNLKIVGWVPRGDLVWKPHGGNLITAMAQGTVGAAPAGNGAAPTAQVHRPATGATRAVPPTQQPQQQPQAFDASDFG